MVNFIKALLVVAAFIAPRGSDADGYGSGIAKNTYAASNPGECKDFFFKYLPVRCQDSQYCDDAFSCGYAGRVALCDASSINSEGSCATPQGPGNDFGLHSVNTTARGISFTKEGVNELVFVENLFAQKFIDAVQRRDASEAFLDFSTMFYTPQLGSYVKALSADGIKFLALAWKDDEGTAHYSIIIILELVSNSKPSSLGIDWISTELPRLPAEVFTNNKVSSQDSRILQVLAVSKATTNLQAVENFYVENLEATSSFHAQSAASSVKTYKLSGADAQIRFVQRPINSTSGSFTVKDLENMKKASHQKFTANEFCGVSKWYDNHFAWDQFTIKLDTLRSRFDEQEIPYHIFGDGLGMTNIYVNDPSGDSIQLDGGWINIPINGTGDSLMNACSQGACGAFMSEMKMSCKEAILAAAPGLKGKDNLCTDVLYRKWDGELADAGCSIADVVNYCTDATLACYDKCDNTGFCGAQGSSAKCADLVKTYSCNQYYGPTDVWSGWCDKQCSFGACTSWD